MHRIPILLLFAALAAVPAAAQNATPDSSAWKKELAGKLSVTQAGFHQWADGGTNSLAVSAGVDGKAEHTVGRWTQLYEMRAGFGFIDTDTLDFRKAEDLIVLKATYSYQGEGFFKRFEPTALATFRSQFWEGFDYKKRRPDGTYEKVSDALSPATLVQQVGLTHESTAWMRHRFGFAAKETIVLIERLREKYKVDPDRSIRFEAGLGFITDVDAELAENIHYKSTLSLFAAFNQADAPDLLWENHLSMKVNAWLSTNVEWVMLWDKDRTDLLQMREVFSIGITYRFI